MKKYKIDVYITDDHQLLNEGLTEVINHSNCVHVSKTFTTLADCKTALADRRPDVLLMDISMPDGDAGDFCSWAISTYPNVKIIVVTIHDEYSVVKRMMDRGVQGYLLKSSTVDELIEAIVSVWRGHTYIGKEVEDIIREGNKKMVVLTPVEEKVLALICRGCTNPQIAQQLNLSTETINWYRKRLLTKFGVNNAVNLVTKVIKERIIS